MQLAARTFPVLNTFFVLNTVNSLSIDVLAVVDTVITQQRNTGIARVIHFLAESAISTPF